MSITQDIDAPPMAPDQVIALFRDAGAILNGHFILSSGRHSPIFIQKARVFMQPRITETLCRALAQRICERLPGPIDMVVSPALGGIIPGYETARHLGVPAVWVEREAGQFRLRRFDIAPGARVVVVEDIVTTGLSSRETVACLERLGVRVRAVACLIDRAAGRADAGAPLISLAEYDVPSYAPGDVPEALAAIPASDPGSRRLTQPSANEPIV